MTCSSEVLFYSKVDTCNWYSYTCLFKLATSTSKPLFSNLVAARTSYNTYIIAIPIRLSFKNFSIILYSKSGHKARLMLFNANCFSQSGIECSVGLNITNNLAHLIQVNFRVTSQIHPETRPNVLKVAFVSSTRFQFTVL